MRYAPREDTVKEKGKMKKGEKHSLDERLRSDLIHIQAIKISERLEMHKTHLTSMYVHV